MLPRNVPASAVYRPTARFLHWLIALMVLLTIPAGQVMIMEGLPRAVQNTLFLFHKNGGVLIGGLMLLRLGFRLVCPPPPLPASVPPLQARIAALTHSLLYVLVLGMAASGYLRVVAGGYPVEALDALGVPHLVDRNPTLEKAAQATHFYARFALIAVLLAHIGAALYHGVWLRDGIMDRMWPRKVR